MVAMEVRAIIIATVPMSKKMLYQKLESYRFELSLKKLGWLGQYKI